MVLNDFLNKIVKGMQSCSTISLRTLGGQLSGPAALFGFRLLNFVYTISGVIGTSFRMGASTFMLKSGNELPSSMVKTLEKNLINALSLSDSITQPSDVVRSLIGNLD